VFPSVQPFNLTDREYAKMFERQVPEGLYSHLSLIPLHGTADADADRERRKIDDADYGILINYFLPNGISVLELTVSLLGELITMLFPIGGLSNNHLLKFQPDLNPADWIYKGIYLQIGFGRRLPCSCDGRLHSMTSAMVGYDILVATTGSIEPKDHNPSILQPINKLAWENVIQTAYSSSCCLMIRDLIETRNKWLILARAVLMGRNPIVEWKRFKAAGGWYFLQYPTLCP
jgi:hypothetical protein